MGWFELEWDVLGRPIRVSVHPCGTDLSVTIQGGDAPHVGSVAVAQNGEIVSKWVGQGHRDDVVGDHFAAVFSEHTDGTVCVSCGIHYERPTRKQLAEIVSACGELLAELLERMKQYGADSNFEQNHGAGGLPGQVDVRRKAPLLVPGGRALHAAGYGS